MKLFLFIAAGLILSPTLLNIPKTETVSLLGTIAAYVFLFAAGLELSLKKTLAHLKEASWISVGAFIFPLMTGYAGALYLLPEGSNTLFVATAMAVSALPVIIQLLKEANLYTTNLGRLIVSAATLCDILAWIMFSFLLPPQSMGPWIASHLPVFVFMAGLFISDWNLISEKRIEQLESFTRWVFAPIFFVTIGWGLNLAQHFDARQVAIVTLIAFAGKIIGSYAVSRWRKFNHTDSMTIGLSLNARGAMEILMATFGLKAGLIDMTLFTSLVAMAIITSMVPALTFRLQRKLRQ